MTPDDFPYIEELKNNCFIQEAYFIKLVKYEHKDIIKSCQIAFQLENYK